MDADVVPGSVTDWTVTIEDQRRLKQAWVGIRLRSAGLWGPALGAPVLLSGFVWFWARDLIPGDSDDTFVLAAAVALGLLLLVLTVVMSLVTVGRRVEREYPVGATLTAWATESGMGVRTLNRLTFYPWSRLSQVTVGPVLVRSRQSGPRTIAAPLYLPVGPDELSRSVDFPVQLIGAELRRELVAGTRQKSEEPPMAGKPVTVDHLLRLRLIGSWVRAEAGILAWVLPTLLSFNVVIQWTTGSHLMAVFFTVVALLNPVTWLLAGHGRITGMYPAGAGVVGSVGEWLEIQGPWGSVAWQRAWLTLRRTTKHTVTYEVLRPGRDGMPVPPDSVDKRFVVIPRAFVDVPAPAVSAEV